MVPLTHAGSLEISLSGKNWRSTIAQSSPVKPGLPIHSDALLKAVIDNATDCIFIKDISLSYILVNKAMCDLFQLDCSDILGRTDADLFGEDAARLIAEMDGKGAPGRNAQGDAREDRQRRDANIRHGEGAFA